MCGAASNTLGNGLGRGWGQGQGTATALGLWGCGRWKAKKTRLPIQHVCYNKRLQMQLKGGAEALYTLKCGIVLQGSEVKSMRNNMCDISAAFVEVNETAQCNDLNKKKDGLELWLYQAVMAIWRSGAHGRHDIHRKRKLLANKKEIRHFHELLRGGKKAVPLRLYFDESGYGKVDVVVLAPPKKADKRQKIDKKDYQRNRGREGY